VGAQGNRLGVILRRLVSRGNQNEKRVNQDENAAGGVMAGFAPSGVTIGGTTP
jgi:hypothetical protein